MRMSLWHRRYSPATDTVYLFGQSRTRDLEEPQVFLHTFALPKAAEEYRAELGAYRRHRQAFKLDGGGKFDSQLLAIRQVAPDLQHEAFRTREGRSRRRIVHVYTGADRAAIVVFSLNSACFNSNRFFQQLTDNLKVQ